MEAGELRHRMQVQSKGQTRGSSGGLVDAWGTDRELQCAIRQLAGRALETAQAIYPESTHEIKTRYVSGITTEQRGLFRGKVFDFLNVNDVDERHRELRILAKEGLSNG